MNHSVLMKRIATMNLILYVPACLARGFVFARSYEGMIFKVITQLILSCTITSGAYLSWKIFRS